MEFNMDKVYILTESDRVYGNTTKYIGAFDSLFRANEVKDRLEKENKNFGYHISCFPINVEVSYYDYDFEENITTFKKVGDN